MWWEFDLGIFVWKCWCERNYNFGQKNHWAFGNVCWYDASNEPWMGQRSPSWSCGSAEIELIGRKNLFILFLNIINKLMGCQPCSHLIQRESQKADAVPVRYSL